MTGRRKKYFHCIFLVFLYGFTSTNTSCVFFLCRKDNSQRLDSQRTPSSRHFIYKTLNSIVSKEASWKDRTRLSNQRERSRSLHVTVYSFLLLTHHLLPRSSRRRDSSSTISKRGCGYRLWYWFWLSGIISIITSRLPCDSSMFDTRRISTTIDYQQRTACYMRCDLWKWCERTSKGHRNGIISEQWYAAMGIDQQRRYTPLPLILPQSQSFLLTLEFYWLIDSCVLT